ncbi:uncharacterized protein LOC128264698 [Drosophila gunungcola]|uniref:Uncharacterized protein n=1 Tax=Drosophila gunungcola TaxID=103775 RepID=A0A9Q0BJK2_9MUSC|nr:uncharacterized protein LOC128264698 [Drosophila gunungcola]XP_052856292.1 uncharacterized protein LOC128264698 [Drosophila gunungcola]KAI8034251.1 hypothetical protein M5D96_012917 [Drosophila gunungcola]
MPILRRNNIQQPIGPDQEEHNGPAIPGDAGAGDMARTRAKRTSSTSPSLWSLHRRHQSGNHRALRAIVPPNEPTMENYFRQVAKQDKTTSASIRVKIVLFLAYILVPSIMKLNTHLEFNVQWQQINFFKFLKFRRLAMTFAGNVCVALISSIFSAMVPFYCVLRTARPNRNNLVVPRADGSLVKMPVNINAMWVGILPYVISLLDGFGLFAKETWVAYKDHVFTIADTYSSLRVLIYLIHAMQLLFAIELMLLMVQGLFGFVQAVRLYILIAGKDYTYAEQFKRRKQKNRLWFIPTLETKGMYHTLKDRILGYFPPEQA